MDRGEITARVVREIEGLASARIESPDEEIFKTGFLDSLNIVHILLFIEKECGVNIDPFEINLDTVGSVNRIVDFVIAKKRSRPIP